MNSLNLSKTPSREPISSIKHQSLSKTDKDNLKKHADSLRRKSNSIITKINDLFRSLLGKETKSNRYKNNANAIHTHIDNLDKLDESNNDTIETRNKKRDQIKNEIIKVYKKSININKEVTTQTTEISSTKTESTTETKPSLTTEKTKTQENFSQQLEHKHNEIKTTLKHFGKTNEPLNEIDKKLTKIMNSEIEPDQKLKEINQLEKELKTELKKELNEKANSNMKILKKNVQTSEAKHHLNFQKKCADSIANVKTALASEKESLIQTVKESLQTKGFFRKTGVKITDEDCENIAQLILTKEYGNEYSFAYGGNYEPKSDAEFDSEIGQILRHHTNDNEKVNTAISEINEQVKSRSTDTKKRVLKAPMDAMVIFVNTNNSYSSQMQSSIMVTETYQSIAKSEDLSLSEMVTLDQQMTQTSKLHEIMLLSDRSKTTVTKDRLETLIKKNCKDGTSDASIKGYLKRLMTELESNGVITKEERENGQVFKIDTKALETLTDNSDWTQTSKEARKVVENFGKRRGLYEKYVKGIDRNANKTFFDKTHTIIEAAFKDETNIEKLKSNPTPETIRDIIKGAIPNTGPPQIPANIVYNEFIDDITDLVSTIFRSKNIVKETEEGGKVQTTELGAIEIDDTVINEGDKFKSDLIDMLQSTYMQNQSGQAGFGIENMSNAFTTKKMGNFSPTDVVQYKCSDLCARIKNSKSKLSTAFTVKKEVTKLAEGTESVKDVFDSTNEEKVENIEKFMAKDNEGKAEALLEEAGITSEMINNVRDLLTYANKGSTVLTNEQARLMAKTELGESASESAIATKTSELISMSIEKAENIHGQLIEVSTGVLENLQSIAKAYGLDETKTNELISLALESSPVLGSLVTSTKFLAEVYKTYKSDKLKTQCEKTLKFSGTIDQFFNASKNRKHLFQKMLTARADKKTGEFNAACELINLFASPLGVSVGSSIKALKTITTFGDLKEDEYKSISEALLEHHSQAGLHQTIGRTSEEATSDLVSTLQKSVTDPDALHNLMKSEGNYGDLKGPNLELAKQELKENMLNGIRNSRS